MIQLGSVYPAALNVYDASGIPVNCATLALTIGLPDGTIATPGVTNPPAVTGAYLLNYTTTQSGRHTIRWVGTTPDVAYTDVFDVADQYTPSILSLAQAKRQLGMDPSYTDDDAELLDKLAAMTNILEEYKHEIIPMRTIVEEQIIDGTFWGSALWPFRGSIRLWNYPTISLVSIARSDATFTWDIANFDLDNTTGLVTLINGPPLRGRILFTYLAGYRIIPPRYVEGASIQLQAMWDTRRGPGGVGGVIGPEELQDYRHFNSMPRKVIQLLGPPRPVVA